MKMKKKKVFGTPHLLRGKPQLLHHVLVNPGVRLEEACLANVPPVGHQLEEACASEAALRDLHAAISHGRDLKGPHTAPRQVWALLKLLLRFLIVICEK